jgi:hypothetical protein
MESLGYFESNGMRRRSGSASFGLILLAVGVFSAGLRAQTASDREKARGTPVPGNAGKPTPAGAVPAAPQPDFKVVFWFDGQRFRSQAYDVRKGQYTKAVADWVAHDDIDRSGYAGVGRLATVRNVYLDREQGRTEKEKLASATERELTKIGNFDPRELRGVQMRVQPYVPPQPRPVPPQPRPVPRAYVPPPLRLASPAYAAPQPFPYPYPRPHP